MWMRLWASASYASQISPERSLSTTRPKHNASRATQPRRRNRNFRYRLRAKSARKSNRFVAHGKPLDALKSRPALCTSRQAARAATPRCSLLCVLSPELQGVGHQAPSCPPLPDRCPLVRVAVNAAGIAALARGEGMRCAEWLLNSDGEWARTSRRCPGPRGHVYCTQSRRHA